MGQKTDDVIEHYINPNNYKALKENYRKALPYLAIFDEIIIGKTPEEVEKVINENQVLKEVYISDSKLKDEEIRKLRQENAITKEMLEKF